MKKIAALILTLSFNYQISCYGSVNALITNAIKGDADSQFELAKYYEKKDYKALMFQWYEKAAENGNIQAQELLANKYFNKGDVDKAFSLSQKLSDNGSEVGKSILAYYYCWGAYEVPVDKNLAWKLANESSNNSLSKAVLANFYSNGFWGVKKDLDKAIKLAEESFDEGCLEGGCIYNRIIDTFGRKNKSKYDQICEMLKNGDYIDGIINTYLIRSIREKNLSKTKKIIEPYLDSKSGYLYYFLGRIEGENSREKAIEYYKKAADFGEENSIFELFKIYLNKTRYNPNVFNKVKEMVSLAIKTKQTNLIAKLYYLLKEADIRYRVSEKALPDDIDWEKIIKECADNGHPVFMLIHAYNIGKDNNDYTKYINQAKEMGVVRLIPNCLKYCEDKKKWLELGVELEDSRSLASVGKGKLNGFVVFDRNRVKFDKNENEGISCLESAAKQGDISSSQELFEYYCKYIELPNSFSRIFKDKLTAESEDKNIDLEKFKKAYFWGKISNASGSRKGIYKDYMNYISNKITSEELKEIDNDVSNFKKEIEQIKDKQKEKEEYYMPIEEMEFLVVR